MIITDTTLVIKYFPGTYVRLRALITRNRFKRCSFSWYRYM